MDRTGLLTALQREADAFRAVLETADLASPVTACPGWDLTGLAAHLAGTHRWARNALVEGELRVDPTPQLADRAAVVAWYRSCADGLIAALRDTPDHAPCRTFLSPEGTAAFWLRRQAHELAVHRYDAELATGQEPALDGELAADGVSEVLEVFLPRMRARGLLGDLPAAILLQRTDGPGRWALGDGEPAATVSASGQVLLLILWKRLSLDDATAEVDVEVDGDADAVRAVMAAALTP